MRKLQLPKERQIEPAKVVEYLLHPVKGHGNAHLFYKLGFKMIDENTQVVLKRALPGLGLEPGDVGIVVHVYHQGAAYEVEFLSLDGNTIGVVTVAAADLRQASGRAVLHERELSAS